jgi:hypothetical protein
MQQLHMALVAPVEMEDPALRLEHPVAPTLARVEMVALAVMLHPQVEVWVDLEL